MTDEMLRWPRRSMLGGLAATLLAGRSHAEGDAPSILVAGPAESEAGAWARLLRAPLAAALMVPGQLQLDFVGGRDGVTGANQFEISQNDGDDALMLPGRAPLADLAGDSRVRFQICDKIAVLAAVGPGLLMLRGGLGRARNGAPVRVACAEALEPALTGLLGLHLLGIDSRPTAASQGCVAAAQAGKIDAVFLTGAALPAMQATLSDAGFSPAFAAGHKFQPATQRDHALYGVPPLPALLSASAAASPLAEAWRAVAAASTLHLALALPPLSGPWVTSWRHAAALTLAMPAVQAYAQSRALWLLNGNDAGVALAATRAEPMVQLAFRRWLGTQLKWQPV